MNNGGHRILQLETSKLEEVSQTYPEQMREPLIWLGGYVLHECSRNLDILEKRVKDLKFTTTADTFSKILRGRWNKDANGKALDAPVMKLNNFLEIVEKLRELSRITKLAGKIAFVETDTWFAIKDYIDVRRSAERVCKFGFITGPTGAQKTACFQHYSAVNNHGCCVWMESPSRPSFSQFVTDLAHCYGISTSWTLAKKMTRIRECVNASRTIIIDNVQRLYRAADGGNQEIFGYTQKLQDETDCTVIFSATPDFKGKFISGVDKGYFEQFVGRCGGENEFLELPPYTPRQDALQIADAFGLLEAEKHAKYLTDIATRPGRIRVYFQSFQSAKQLANGEKLTIDHLRAALGED